jgi:hypothetical protein
MAYQRRKEFEIRMLSKSIAFEIGNVAAIMLGAKPSGRDTGQESSPPVQKIGRYSMVSPGKLLKRIKDK